jgi:DNA-binding transcriptional LysR family regulator
LAVATGAGLALLPESAAERYAAPGVRFVPLEGVEPAFESVVLTHRDTSNLATAAFVRALALAGSRNAISVSRPTAAVAA